MHICRTLDVDGSGFLDLKEFLLAIELVAARTPEDKLLWAFRQYDTDNSGCVDRGVFKKYVCSRCNSFLSSAGPNGQVQTNMPSKAELAEKVSRYL